MSFCFFCISSDRFKISCRINVFNFSPVPATDALILLNTSCPNIRWLLPQPAVASTAPVSFSTSAAAMVVVPISTARKVFLVCPFASRALPSVIFIFSTPAIWVNSSLPSPQPKAEIIISSSGFG